MPSIPPRPLALLSPFTPCDGNDFDKRSHSDDSIHSDSDSSETSTMTNSPLSCYSSIKCPSNPAESLKDDDSSEHHLPSNTTEEPLEACNHDNNESSLSSSDETSSDLFDRDNDCDDDSDSVCAVKPQQESLEKQMEKEGKEKKSVGFEPLSTLYVFEDDTSGNDDTSFYDIDNTWYSIEELKSFRADAFLTINWLVTKTRDPKSKELQDSCSSFSSNGNGRNESYNYYSNKYGYNRQKELQSIAEESNYEFCERGIECRTPLGRYKKNKRRLDAMRVVMLYQQMQKQHRRELKRQERRQQQRQYNSSLPRHTIQRHAADPEAIRRIEADVDAKALSNVYSAYSKDSAAEALERGQTDAIAVGMPSTTETRETITTTDATPTIIDCPSIMNEEDELMDQFISVSFGDEESEHDEEESTTLSVSEVSLSLEDLAVAHDEKDEDPQEVSGVVEVELVEGNEANPHRISYSEVTPTGCKNDKLRRKSWSHPDWTTTFSCNSLSTAAKQQKIKSPPTSASFSSLEMGGLLFGSATSFNWW